MIIKQTKPLGGTMLISQPSLTDRFFNKSVVILVDHGNEGSFGVIVNKPANIKLSAVTNEFAGFDADLYLGGPVQINSLFYIHTKGELVKDSLKIIDDVYWGGDIHEIRDLISSGKMTEKDIRFFAGYSGWEPKQLNREMKENSWIVINGLKRFVFNIRPSHLWKQLVLNLGKEYAPWVNYPADPTMN